MRGVELFTAAIQHSFVGRYLDRPYTYLTITRPSIYLRHSSRQQQNYQQVENSEQEFTGDAPYFFIYPFTKTHGWYQLPYEQRREMMLEHPHRKPISHCSHIHKLQYRLGRLRIRSSLWIGRPKRVSRVRDEASQIKSATIYPCWHSLMDLFEADDRRIGWFGFVNRFFEEAWRSLLKCEVQSEGCKVKWQCSLFKSLPVLASYYWLQLKDLLAPKHRESLLKCCWLSATKRDKFCLAFLRSLKRPCKTFSALEEQEALAGKFYKSLRLKAIDGSVRLQVKEAIKPLLKLIKSGSVCLRLRALWALGKLRDSSNKVVQQIFWIG